MLIYSKSIHRRERANHAQNAFTLDIGTEIAKRPEPRSQCVYCVWYTVVHCTVYHTLYTRQPVVNLQKTKEKNNTKLTERTMDKYLNINNGVSK